MLEVSTYIPNAGYRAFDIAYEQASGDALIVYETSTAADQTVAYRIWNGSSYSAEQTLTTGVTASAINWVELVSRFDSDEIMLLVHNSEADGSGDVYAVPWNGTGFDTTKEQLLSTATTSSTEQHFAYAWEEGSGQGIVTYGEGTNLVYRGYTGSGWTVEQTIGIGDGLDAVRMCSDPNSDYIGIIMQDAGDDVNVLMWTGSGIINNLFDNPTEDATTETAGVDNVNLDCVWKNKGGVALFGFVDSGATTIDYFNFTIAGNSWSTSALTTTDSSASFATAGIRSLRFRQHPRTNETMVTAMDTSEDISMIRWTGSIFSTIENSPIETSTEVGDGAQEAVMFDWERFDAKPNVTDISPANGTIYIVSDNVTIRVNVTDDFSVDDVIANVTLPNGTILQVTLFDTNSDNEYNGTFNVTNLGGVYNILIIANDTSNHLNINDSESVNITITDNNNPLVFDVRPINRSVFNVSTVIEIAANVTDIAAVDTVLANLTYANGSYQLFALTNVAGNKYNTSFTIPGLLGVYNITFIANDTSNNLNNTIKTNFTVVDQVSPVVTLNSPSVNYYNDTALIISVDFNCSVTDNYMLKNLSLYLTNSLNSSFVRNQTINVNGTSNSTNWTLKLNKGNYTWNCLAYDVMGNFDWGINRTIKSNSTISDSIPYWSNNQTSIVASYQAGNRSYFNITWQDDLGVDLVWFESNYSGAVTNYSMNNIIGNVYNYSAVFAAGSYYWKSYANDTIDQFNVTTTWNFSIAKATTNLTLLADPSSWTATTETQINVTCYSTNLEVNVTLYRNDSYLNSSKGSIVADLNTLTTGHYNYICNTTGSQNYSSLTTSNTLIITDRLTSSCSLNITPDSPQTYPTDLNASCSCDNPEVSANLYRNGTNVNSENYTIINYLAAGSYSYVCNVSQTQNYTTASNSSTFILNKNTSIVNLTLNGNDGSIYSEAGNFVNVTGYLNNPSSGTIILFKNGTAIQNGSVYLSNYTNYTLPRTYNFTIVYTGNENYTSVQEQHLLNVSDTIAPTVTITTPIEADILGFTVLLRANATDYNLDTVRYEIRNGSILGDVINNGTMNLVSTDIYNGTLYTNNTWPYNIANFNTTNLTLVVFVNDTSGNIVNTSTTWILDNTKPSIQYVNPPQNGMFVNSNFSLNIFLANHKLNYSWYNITNSSGQVLFNQSNHSTATYTWTDLINVDNLADGNYTITMYVNDTSTPQNYNNKSSWFYVDQTVPNATTATSVGGWFDPTPANNSYTSTQTQTFNFSCNETFVDTVWVVLSNGTTDTSADSTAGIYYSFNFGNLAGTYTYTGYCNDTSANQAQTTTRTINVDIVAPTWSNNETNVTSGSSYSSSRNYQFNVTWNDNYFLDNVYVEHNFTGTLTNYTPNNYSGEYNYNYTALSAGYYVWRSYANDTAGNQNQTDQWPYIVTKAISIVNLTINGSDSNLVVEAGSFVNISGYLNNPSIGTIILYKNGTAIQNGSVYLSNYTNYTLPRNYNFTIVYTGNENYTSVQEQHVLIINDTTSPTVTITTPVEADILGFTVLLRANATDKNLDTVRYEIRNGTISGKVINNGTMNLISTDIYNGTLYTNNTWPYNIANLNSTNLTLVVFVNDTSGNIVNTSTTWILDNTKPSIQYVNPPQNGMFVNSNFSLNIFLANHKLNYSWYNITNSSGQVLFNQSNHSTATYTWTDLINVDNLADGNYTITMYVNDTSTPQNYNNKSSWFYVDQTVPNATTATSVGGWFDPTPANNSYTSTQTQTFNFSCNETFVDTVWVVLSNGTTDTSADSTAGIYYSFNFGNLAGTYTYTGYCNDTSANQAQTTTRTINVDIVAPTWSNNETNVTSGSSYSSSRNYQFNVTWNDNYFLDNVYVEHNFTGTLINYTPDNYSGEYNYNYTALSAGYYVWRSYANDTLGNQNQTYQWPYIVNKADTILTLVASPGFTANVGTQTNVTCFADNSEVNVSLYRNNSYLNSSKGSIVSDVQSFAGGNYGYVCNTTGSHNYTNSSQTNILEMTTLGLSNCSLSISPVSPQTYPVGLNVSCGCTNPEATATLFRNGTNVDSENNTIINYLAAGNYGYVCNVSASATYTAGSNSSTFILNKNISIVNLTLNDNDTSIYSEAGNFVNVTGYLNNPSSGTIILYKNGTAIQNGSVYLSNYTNYTLPRTYNFTIVYTGNENYTSVQEQHLLNVSDTTAPTVSITTPIESDILGFTVLLRANATDKNLDTVRYEIRNGSILGDVINNGTMNLISTDIYNGTLYSNNTWPYNIANFNSTNLTLVVFANDTSGNIVNTSTTWVLDNTKPSIQYINPPQNGLFVNSNFSLNIFLANHKLNYSWYNITLDGVQVLFNQSNHSTATYTWTDLINVDNLVEGNYTITMYVNDTSSPQNYNNKTSWFYVDKTTTNVTSSVTNPTLPLYNNGSTQVITANFTSSEYPVNVTFNLYNATGDLENSLGPIQLNDSSELPLSYTIPNDLGDGNFSLNMSVVDRSGNVNETNLGTIIVDATFPQIDNPITTPSAPIYNNGSTQVITANFTSSEYPVNVTFNLYNTSGQLENSLGPIQLNDSSELPLSYTIPNDLGDGNYSLNMSVVDRAGNVNETNLGTTVVDATFPQIDNPVTTPSAPIYNNGSTQVITANFTSSEYLVNVTFNLYNTSGQLENTLGPIQLNDSSELPLSYTIPNDLGDDNYSLNMSVVDRAGNVNTTSLGTMVVDSNVPVVSIITPLEADIVGFTVLLRVNVSDSTTDVVRYEIRNGSISGDVINNGTMNLISTDVYNATLYSNDTWPYVVANLNSTNITLVIFANDSIGNLVNASTTWVLDNTKPSIQYINPPQNGMFINSNFSLNIFLANHKLNYSWYNITNSSGQVLFNQSNHSTATYTWTDLINVDNLADGNYTITMYVNDTSTPQNYNNKSSWFYVDQTVPNATVVAGGWVDPTPANNTYTTTQTHTFNFTCSETFVDTVWINLSNGTIDTSADSSTGVYYSFTFGNLNGNYNYTGYCNDTSNNIAATETRKLIVDITLPLAGFGTKTESDGAAIARSYIQVNASVTEPNLANITIYFYNATSLLNTTIFTSSPIFLNFTNLTDGLHYFNYTAYDLAGNKNNSLTRTVTVGGAGTTVTLISPDNLSIDGNGNVNFSCTGIASAGLSNISLWFEGIINQTLNANTTSHTANFSIENLSNAKYIWSCSAYNSAGTLSKSDNRTLIVNSTLLPTINTSYFDGNTTDWSTQADLTNVCNGNAVLDRVGIGLIQWIDCVNVTNQSFNPNVIITQNNVTVNFGLNPSFNATAKIKIRNLSWEDTPEIYRNGVNCTSCYDISYNGSLVEFYVDSFSSYTTIGNSQLGIWDETDSGQAYAGFIRDINEKVVIFANYTRVVNDNAITGADCNINFTDKNGIMVYNSSRQLYQYNRTFSQNGSFAYNITCDKLGTEKLTTNDTVVITDSSAPNVTNLGPVAGSSYNQAAIVEINATVVDVAVDIVNANVTLPNGTSVIVNLNHTNGNLYFNNFTNTNLVGGYNITIIANDSLNNVNNTIKTYFTILDITVPLIVLNNPANYTNVSGTSAILNFTATDNYYSTLNCSLILDNVINLTNSAVVNGTSTTFTPTGLVEGIHTWQVNCSDTRNNSNVSKIRTFFSDNSVPTFVSLTTNPSSIDDLDPNVNITVLANVTDNVTILDVVLFQYKLSSSSNYINISMNYNSTSGLYFAYLNATTAGTYNLRLYANDSAGNLDFSNLINISVEYDRTWARTPSSFSAVNANLSQIVVMGNLTINNTGDFGLNFTIVSDSNLTSYNETENFTLAAKEVKSIQVSENATTIGVKTVTLNITANQNPDVDSRLTTGQVVVAQGQPVLSVEFTTPSADTISVTQGDTGVEFTAKVTNIGVNPASNVTLFLVIPENWTITFGATSVNFGSIAAGANEEISILVTIPANDTTGEKTVLGNVTGYNLTGTLLNAINLTFADTVIVTVGSPTVDLGGTGGGSPGDAGGSVGGAGGAATGGGGGGGGISPFKKSAVIDVELFETRESFEITRGLKDTFPIKITNVYESATMYDVQVSVAGYLSHYLSISPNIIDEILPGETKEFVVKIASATYMDRGEYDLVFTINADLIGTELTLLATGEFIETEVSKDLIETRIINLIINEVAFSDAEIDLNEIEQIVKDMQEAGITTIEAEALLEQARKAFSEKRYGDVTDLAEQISSLAEAGFSAKSIIDEVKQRIANSEEMGISMEEAKHLLNLAIAAFERGDFSTAIKRAREAQLTQLLLAKGRFNLLWFLTKYWWAVIISAILLSMFSLVARKRIILTVIKRKMVDLDKEGETINNLTKELQVNAFRKKTISMSEYDREKENYEKRRSKITLTRIKLRNKRLGLIKTSQEIGVLQEEKKELSDKIKLLQQNYYNKKSVTSKTYQLISSDYKLRRAEIEKSIAVLEAKFIKKKKLQDISKLKGSNKKLTLTEKKPVIKKDYNKGISRLLLSVKRILPSKEKIKGDFSEKDMESHRLVLVNKLNRWKAMGYETKRLEKLMKKKKLIKKDEILDGEELIVKKLVYKIESWKKLGLNVESLENMLNDYLRWDKKK